MVVAFFAYFLQSVNLKDSIELLFSTIEDLGFWGPALLILSQAVITVLLVPGPFFTLGAGFLFGVMGGTVISITGILIGSLSAFLIARHFFSNKLAERILNHRRLRLLKVGLTDQGWKFIMTTRLFPFFPFKLSNYFFGLTPVTFKQFALGNVLGIIPYQVLGVYTGSLLSSLGDFRNPQLLNSPVSLTIYTLGFFFCVGMIIYISRKARQSLAPVLGSDIDIAKSSDPPSDRP